jgi:hypothetical protein
MPIVDIQIRMRELGRIRTGNQVAAGNGRKRPAKLETFRLTSGSKDLMDAAALVYGGEVVPWESPAGRQWELITKTDVLSIIIPPGQALSQWYELWSGGGCQRRCDGELETLSDGPCLCPADRTERRELAQDGQACKPTTRLNVLLPDLPDLGMFRLESHGYYAAVELAGAAQFLSMASASGMNIPAKLRLEQREKKVPGKPTNRYAVPVIEFTTTRIIDLLNAGAGPLMLGEAAPAAPQLAAGELLPEKGKRTRGPKVERPAMGPAPAVPDGSGFGRPQPVAATAPTLPGPAATEPPAAPPAAPPQPTEPATVAGGWPVVDELPPAPAKPVKVSKAPPPPPLSAEQLRDQIQALPPEQMGQARAVFERRFPNVKSLSELDDDARGRYWAELIATQGATSAA